MIELSSLHLFESTDSVAWVGSGGKTSLMFAVARKLFSDQCLLTTTTKMATSEIELADHHLKTDHIETVDLLSLTGLNLVYSSISPVDNRKIVGFEPDDLESILIKASKLSIPVMIEADGSRRKPCKFPSVSEPVLPDKVSKMCVVIGLSCLNKPLDEEYFFRVDEISKIVNISPGDIFTIEHLKQLLNHPQGFLNKGDAKTRKILILNQADMFNHREQINSLALSLKPFYENILLTEISQTTGQMIIHAHWGRLACIILAAGGSDRFGSPKQLAFFQGKTFVEKIIETSNNTFFEKRLLVLGANHKLILEKIQTGTQMIVINDNWMDGQAISVVKSIRTIQEDNIDAVVFLLVDQPQIDILLINEIIHYFAYHKTDIILHRYEGQNRHPVLFSAKTFPFLMELKGDQGGKQIFHLFEPAYIEIVDKFQAMDVDSPTDYEKLLTFKQD